MTQENWPLPKQEEEIQRPVSAEANWTGRGCRAGRATPAGCFESASAVNGALNFQVSVMRDDLCAAERRRAGSNVPQQPIVMVRVTPRFPQGHESSVHARRLNRLESGFAAHSERPW